VTYLAVFAGNQSQREAQIKSAALFPCIHGRVLLFGIDQLPSAIGNAAHGSMSRLCVQTLTQQFGPVAGHDFVETIDDIFKLVWHNHGRTALAAMKKTAEIVERF